MLQDFEDMELVISNNGADSALKAVALRYLGDGRVRYVEQPEVLDMPAHWEKVTRELLGEYILVLTDRSLMRDGTLHYLYEQIIQMKKFPDVISWPWDVYYDHLKVLLRYPAKKRNFQIINSDSTLNEIARGSSHYPYCLPRGLNSCVRNEFIATIRSKHGQVFRPLNPDFTFGFLCLQNTEYFIYVDSPMFVSQGLKVSNGGNSFSGDASPYFNSLKLENTFKLVPVKLSLVQNGIHEDFLAMASLCSHYDLSKWDRSNYYMECFAEIDAKREAGLLQSNIVDEMEQHLINALMNEPLELWKLVKRTRTLTKKLRIRIAGVVRKLLGTKLESVMRFILLNIKGGVVVATALEAAGFDESKIK